MLRPDGYLATDEVASRLGIDQRTVRRMVADGRDVIGAIL